MHQEASRAGRAGSPGHLVQQLKLSHQEMWAKLVRRSGHVDGRLDQEIRSGDQVRGSV